MNRMIFCKKLNKEAEGLEKPPFPGKLGKKIFENISKEAWRIWLDRQTMLINEFQLNMMEKNAQQFIYDAMNDYLFGEISHTSDSN